MNTSVSEVIATTRSAIPDYWESTLAQRAELSGKAAGSVYEGVDTTQLEQMLLAADWEPYSHPAVMQGCEAFRASIPGKLGLVKLQSLAPDTRVVFRDPKKTGQVSAVVEGVRSESADFTVIIIGDDEGKKVVYTFHPGDPVAPSEVMGASPGITDGTAGSVAQALEMGLVYAKV
jgi:hypothetical protein